MSEVVLDDYRRYIGVKGPATVLHNFVADRFFSQAPRHWAPGKPLKLISVGTLKPAKNYAFLIRACKKLPQYCTLDIYGDGPLKEELQDLIEKEKAPVRLCGGRSDIDTLLPLYDVFVMSSSVEGHPVALVEAMASGLPAIMSDIPVLHEATGGKGIYFSLEKPEAFTNAIRDILDGKTDLNEFAVHNHQYAQQTARKEGYLNRLMELYESTLNNRK
ncbi:MAG: glycosyltransferase family 4 protein [Chitinophagaceae bacterium]|nr:glycosyltransferase family 4 protein [Chitinophagaceae bacterium]